MPKRTPQDAHIGGRIRERRKELALTQSTLAAHLGVTYQQIQKYEGGQNAIAAGRLQQLAAVLGVAPGYFYEGLPGSPGGRATDAGIDEREVTELSWWYLRIASRRLRRGVLDLVEAAAAEFAGAEASVQPADHTDDAGAPCLGAGASGRLDLADFALKPEPR